MTDQEIAQKNAQADAKNLLRTQGSQTITPTQIQPQAPINIASTFQQPTDMGTGLVASGDMIQQDIQKYLDAANQPQTETQSLYDRLLGSVSTASENLTGRGASQTQAEQQTGFTQANKELADLNAQYLSKRAEYDKLNANIEATAGGKGLTTSMMLGQQGAVNRAAAADLGLLQAQILGKQGQVEQAQNTANRAVDLIYQDREAVYNTKLKQLELIKDKLTGEESKQAKALEYALNKEQKALEEEKANKKAITEMTLTALSSGAPQSAIDAASKATDTLTAAKILGKYSPETLKYELLKEQIKTEKAQRANINSQIAERNATGTTGVKGKAPTEGQVASAGYADRIQQANSIIDAKTPVLQNLNYAQFKLLESKSQLANKLLNADQRQAAQAMRNFITAKLRKESGAAISPTEFDDARLQYFPSLGDDATTIANKKSLRDSVLNNLIMGSGGAYQPTSISSTPNKFEQATGITNQTIPGTSSVQGFNKDGTINFKLN